jgi:hypothetical protein
MVARLRETEEAPAVTGMQGTGPGTGPLRGETQPGANMTYAPPGGAVCGGGGAGAGCRRGTGGRTAEERAEERSRRVYQINKELRQGRRRPAPLGGGGKKATESTKSLSKGSAGPGSPGTTTESDQQVTGPELGASDPSVPSHPSTTSDPSDMCPEIPAGLRGRLAVSTEVLEFGQILLENQRLAAGGEWWPGQCRARHAVAVIVPYRRRLPQLAIFLRHLHPVLARQQLHYRVYVVNQADSNTFNRAMLLNVGFQEAMKDRNWTCAIFHDVDLLPEDDRNLYSCPEQPRHLSVAVDKFHYKLPYKMLFGGASAIRADQFRLLNGYSNMFWGWGAEDDDMSKRIRHHGLNITRYTASVARYTMLKHKQEPANKMRQSVLRSSHRRCNDQQGDRADA